MNICSVAFRSPQTRTWRAGAMKSPSCPVDRRAGCPVARAQIRQVAAVISDRTHIRPSNYQARRACPGRSSKYSRLDCEPSKLAVGEPQGHTGSLRPLAAGQVGDGAAPLLPRSGRWPLWDSFAPARSAMRTKLTLVGAAHGSFPSVRATLRGGSSLITTPHILRTGSRSRHPAAASR